MTSPRACVHSNYLQINSLKIGIQLLKLEQRFPCEIYSDDATRTCPPIVFIWKTGSIGSEVVTGMEEAAINMKPLFWHTLCATMRVRPRHRERSRHSGTG